MEAYVQSVAIRESSDDRAEMAERGEMAERAETAVVGCAGRAGSMVDSGVCAA